MGDLYVFDTYTHEKNYYLNFTYGTIFFFWFEAAKKIDCFGPDLHRNLIK